MSTLHFNNVSIRRGAVPVILGATVAFHAGRLTAVIGPNGAGKSTMLEAAAGLLPISGGEILLGTESLRGISRRVLARRRAYLPQRANVEWPISVERVVALGLTPNLPAFGNLSNKIMPLIDEAMAACDVAAMRHRPATSLSGGELARVMLARAIVGDPEVLIVDEPTAGLDPRHAVDAVRRLRSRADAGRTVVMAIHDLDLALRFADDVIAVRDGRVLASGNRAEVMTEALLGTLFDISVRIRREDDWSTTVFLD